MQIQGLLTQKPTSPVPQVGEKRRFSVQPKTGKSGKPWNKIKSEGEGYGEVYEVKTVEKTDFVDAHGNVSFNVGIVPINGAAPQTNGNRVVGQTPPREDARHYLMREANLLKLCHDAAAAVIGADYDGEDARTLFITAQRAGYVETMPDKPTTKAEPVVSSTTTEGEKWPSSSEEENKW